MLGNKTEINTNALVKHKLNTNNLWARAKIVSIDQNK